MGDGDAGAAGSSAPPGRGRSASPAPGRPRWWPRRGRAGRGRRGGPGAARPAGAPPPTATRRAGRRGCRARAAARRASRPGRARSRRRAPRRRWRRGRRSATLASRVASKRKPSCGTSTTRRRSEANATGGRRRRRAATAPERGVHQPGEQLGEGGLARPGLADDGDPGAGLDVLGDVAQHQRPAGVAEGDVVEVDVHRPARQRLPRPARGRRGRPGCRGCRSPGASRRSAFWASVSTWVPICTGPTNSVTRNAKASTSPEVISPARPSRMPTMSTPALASPAETPPRENENAVSPWARVLACLVGGDRLVDAVLGAVLDRVGAHDGGADDRLGDRREHDADLAAHHAVGGREPALEVAQREEQRQEADPDHDASAAS